MSLFTCCAGSKRHRQHKTPLKHSSPIERRTCEESPAESAVPTTPSFIVSESSEPPAQAKLTSFRQPASPIHGANIASAVETLSPVDDVKQDSLDEIMANLLNDISSPTFQRSANISKSKTDENMNIDEALFPVCDVLKPNGCIGQSLPLSSHDDVDYDVPSATGDISGAEQGQDQSYYDVPPVPVPCVLPSPDIGNLQLDQADYDVPRPVTDNPINEGIADTVEQCEDTNVTELLQTVTADSTETVIQSEDSETTPLQMTETDSTSIQTGTSGASVKDSTTVSSTVTNQLPSRLSVIEQFKQSRIDILTTLSQLLSCITGSEDTVHVRVVNVISLCSSLQSALNVFTDFIQLLLVKTHTDDQTQSHVSNLNSVCAALDQYLLQIKTLSTLQSVSEINAKLVSIIHITSAIPGLLRTFGPLVESAAVGLPQEGILHGQTDVISDEECLNHSDFEIDCVNEVRDKMTEGNKEDNDDEEIELLIEHDGNESVDSGTQLSTEYVQSSEHIDLLDDTQPPCLPPKQKSNAVTVVNENVALSSDCDRLLSVSQNDLLSCDNYQSVVLRRVKQPVTEVSRISQSELETPDVRASGISQTMVDQLEDLRRQADSQFVRLHTTDNTVTIPMIQDNMNPLSNNDRHLLMFYCCQMNNNWNVLDNTAAAFFHCMERKQTPKVFIMHSKFVILAGHKMAYIGDLLAKNIEDDQARDYIVEYSNRLCDCLKMAVKSTKDAALKYPDIGGQQQMVDSIKNVTDWAIELKELIDRLTYVGSPHHLLS